MLPTVDKYIGEGYRRHDTFVHDLMGQKSVGQLHPQPFSSLHPAPKSNVKSIKYERGPE